MKKLLSTFGLGLLSAGLALAIGRLPFVTTVELKTYDWRLRATADPLRARQDIALITIDEHSLRRLEPVVGRWPWPRLVHAQLLNFLARAPARVIAYDVMFTERDIRTFELEGESWTGAESDAALVESSAKTRTVIHIADAASEPMDGESATAVTAAADRAANVVPAVVRRAGFRLDRGVEIRPLVRWPIEELASASQSIGHNFAVLDRDGPLRRFVPFIAVDGVFIPSLGLAGAIAALRIQPGEVRIAADGLWLRDRRLPLIEDDIPSFYAERRRSHRTLIRYMGGVMHDGRPTYREYSFYSLFYSEQQLLSGVKPEVDPDTFRDAIVVVGATAPGLHDVFSNPFGDDMPGAQVHAAVIDDVLSGRELRPASWGASAGVTVTAAMLLALAGVYLGPWIATVIALAGGVGIAAALTTVFGRGVWLSLSEPLVAVGLSTFGGVAYQYVVEGREKRRVKRLFSRYVSRDVYTQLLDDPALARLGGERRMMSVLFSDIRGFTTVSEQGQPEEILGQLNEYFSRMVPIVFAHRGTIDKFVGDMIMALFGAPVSDPDHADHAVRAAIDMVRELEHLNAQWRQQGRPRLEIGIGINSGEMVAGNVGSESIMSYTVIGDQVNLGARLESLNKDYGTRIIISEATRQSMTGACQLRPLGSVTVKGKTRPVDIYEVIA